MINFGRNCSEYICTDIYLISALCIQLSHLITPYKVSALFCYKQTNFLYVLL